MPVSYIHTEEVNELRGAYNRLNWFQRLFFPWRLGRALEYNLPPLDVILTAFQSTWFFHTWFFQSLRSFFMLLAPSRQLFTHTQVCLLKTCSDSTVSALLKVNLDIAEKGLSLNESSSNLKAFYNHPQRHLLDGIIHTLDAQGLFTKGSAEVLFSVILKHNDPSDLWDNLRQQTQTGWPENKRERIQLINGLLNLNLSNTEENTPPRPPRPENLPQPRNRGAELNHLANEHESSMRQLTDVERESLVLVENHYQPLIDRQLNAGSGFGFYGNQTTTRHALNLVVADLAERFNREQLSIKTVNGNGDIRIRLPLTREQFSLRDFQGDDYSNALATYYKHPTHTAWRYLKGLNDWADVGNWQPNYDAQIEKLITQLWFAVKDEAMPPAPGEGSVEERIQLFITGIAAIARAHNHDDPYTRIQRFDEDGRAILVDGEPIYVQTQQADGSWVDVTGQYDDGQPDRQSCRAGMAARCVEAVQFHPLMDRVLTKEKLNEKVNDCIKIYLQTYLPTINLQPIRQALDNYSETGLLSEADLTVLKSTNISSQTRERLIADLSRLYDFKHAHVKMLDDSLNRCPAHILIAARFCDNENLNMNTFLNEAERRPESRNRFFDCHDSRLPNSQWPDFRRYLPSLS